MIISERFWMKLSLAQVHDQWVFPPFSHSMFNYNFDKIINVKYLSDFRPRTIKNIRGRSRNLNGVGGCPVSAEIKGCDDVSAKIMGVHWVPPSKSTPGCWIYFPLYQLQMLKVQFAQFQVDSDINTISLHLFHMHEYALFILCMDPPFVRRVLAVRCSLNCTPINLSASHVGSTDARKQ